MSLLWLPDLDRDEHARSNPWTETSDPKGCLHTTETDSWPDYKGWTIMPHATILPIPGKGVHGRQHLPFSQGSFSLRNLPGGVQTNRDYVWQFELIGTCARNGPGYYWPDADDAVLLDLWRKVIKPLSDAYGIPIRSRPWQAYPQSYGPRGGTNTVRMSGSDFDTWSGWLGHQHVPENVHGDPGSFPWSRMLAAVDAATKPPEETMDQAGLDDVLKLEVTLSSPAQVAAYNSLTTNPAKLKKVGDTFSLGTWVMWGAAGTNRATAEARAAATAADARAAAFAVQLTALTDAVKALAANSPEAITAAFAAGEAALAAQLAALDIHITVDDGPPAP